MKIIKTIATAYAKKHPGFRKAGRWVYYHKRKFKYWRRKIGRRVEPKTVLFIAFNGKAYGCTPKAVYEYMINDPKYSDWHFTWAFKKPLEHMWLEENPRTKVIKYKGVEFDRAEATSAYWITNYRVFNHVWPTEEQTYVQCWHGTPLKKLGFDIGEGDNAMNSSEEIVSKYKIDAAKFTYILSPSAYCSEKFISAWNLKETGRENAVLEVGYPRNDFLINATDTDVRNIKKKLGLSESDIGDKKIILYAPTWRDNQHKAGVGYTYDLHLDFKKLQQELGNEYVVIFRVHYLISSKFEFGEFEGFIYDYSGHDDINELYLVSDILVTDYSSVIFDYANLKKPALFYMYDLEEYGTNIRGFYFDVNELPGKIITEEDELPRAIRDAVENFSFDEKYKSFNDKFNYLDDGKATQRFVERVFLTDGQQAG